MEDQTSYGKFNGNGGTKMNSMENDLQNFQDLVQDVKASNLASLSSDNVSSSIQKAYLKQFPSLYTMKYKTIRGKPVTFVSKKYTVKHRPWQQQIMDDCHPDKVVEKSRQLGLSETAISEFIWFLDVHDNTKAMYTFPRSSQMNDFSTSRIKPLFQDSPYLSTLLDKTVDNIALKKLRSSYLLMKSAFGSALGEGSDLDLLGFDEYDRMSDGVELAFQESLRASKYGWLRRWSTPTIPGRGVNLLFQKSDKQRYLWTCEHCGHIQYLDFEENMIQVKANGVNKVTQEIEPGTFIIGCSKCKKELNRWGTGNWLAMSPQIKDIRGYHISQMDFVHITADSIMKRQFTYPSRQLFYNYVVGEPYASEGMSITDQDFRDSATMKDAVYSRNSNYQRIVCGIDWGASNWAVILGLTPQGEIHLLDLYYFDDNPMVPLEPVNKLAAVLQAYQPDLIVADAGYGADRNAFLHTRFPKAMWSCTWGTSKNAGSVNKFINSWSEATRVVNTDKTVTMQKMFHTIKARGIKMPPWSEKVAMLSKHVQNVRIIDEEDNGQMYQIATRLGADHLACALAYSLVGMDRLTNYGISKNAEFIYDFL